VDGLLAKADETDIDFIEGIGYQKRGYVEPDTELYKCSLDWENLTDLIQTVSIKTEGEESTLVWLEIYCY
jgi:hypothetical protein